MADIELVIKMPEKIYKHILSMQSYVPGSKKGKSLFEELLKAIRTGEIIKAIRNGIPLPKGHGKLIDADEEIQRFCGKVCGCTLEECGYGFYCPLVRRMISAPAIIDADRREEDNGFFDEITDDESDGEVYEKIKEIIDKAKEQE